jgi:hypothetical protein
MKRAIAMLFVLLVISSVETFTPVNANPYMSHEFVIDPSFVKPPTITITSPKQNALYSNDGTIILSFNVTGPDAPNLLTKYLSMVDYWGDWMLEAKHAYRTKNFETYTPDDFPFSLSFNFSITGIPYGKHSLIITAFGSGGYAEGLTWYSFSKNSSSSVNFVIDKVPVVSFLSFENTTFNNSTIPLNFLVDQPVSKVTYSLDGEKTVVINGNTTLTGLSNGYHNVTLYATNEFENTGSSETVTFTIDYLPLGKEEPFPSLIVAVFVVALIMLVASLLIYVKKRKGSQIK